jgi:hypothetical protein
MTQILNTVGELGPELKQIARDVRTVTLPKVNGTADQATALLPRPAANSTRRRPLPHRASPAPRRR